MCKRGAMGGDAAAKSAGFMGFDELRPVVAAAGAMGALHALAAMPQAVPRRAPGCQQCQRCQCPPVACCSKNHVLLQNKTNSLLIPKLLARKEQRGGRAMPGSGAWGW